MIQVINIKNIFLTISILLMSSPILAIILSALNIDPSINYSIYKISIIPEYIFNTILLMIGVAIVTTILATSLAWFSTFFSFPGRKFFEIMLLLPLAVPSYVLAYVYSYFLNYAGPIQTSIRNIFNLSRGEYYFPDIHSLTGAVILLSLSLYPYVYIFVKARFLTMCNAICVSRIIGLSPAQSFIKIAIPIARPAICASVALVLMEVLADFGALQFLSVNTITTGIYKSWFLLHDHATAARFSAIACILAIMLLVLEKSSRKENSFTEVNPSNSSHECDCYNIGWHANKHHKIMMSFICMIPIILGAIIPISILTYWALSSTNNISISSIASCAINSISLAAITALISVIIAVLVNYISNISKGKGKKSYSIIQTILSMGYAIPGTVISVGILLLLGSLNETVRNISEYLFDKSCGILLIGTISGLVYAYVFRFLAISLGSVESGFSKINMEMDWLARIMGTNHYSRIKNIYAPMLINYIGLSFVLVFIDTIKELPATFIIRPFNFDTIAIKAYELVLDERFQESAIPSLIIIIINIASIAILRRIMGLHKRT